MTLSKENKLKLCLGCHNDYYNYDGHSTTGECWMLSKAKVVTRYSIGWWIPMDKASNFVSVKILSCYSSRGTTAYFENIPDHLQTEWKQLQKTNRLSHKS